MARTSSPISGRLHNGPVVSAIAATSHFAPARADRLDEGQWEPPASSTAAAATGGCGGSGPTGRRDAMERMNTSRSPALARIRTRSPRIAPPVIGDDGSIATTQDRSVTLRASPTRAATRVDLPDPRPVTPTRLRFAPQPHLAREGTLPRRCSVLDWVRSRASARPWPSRAFAASATPPCLASLAVTPRAAGQCRPRMYSATSRIVGARPENGRHAGLLERRDVGVPGSAAGRNKDVVLAPLFQKCRDLGSSVHVRAGTGPGQACTTSTSSWKQVDTARILRRLAQAGVSRLRKPASLSPRASTFAPRSWPSRRTFAMQDFDWSPAAAS